MSSNVTQPLPQLRTEPANIINASIRVVGIFANLLIISATVRKSSALRSKSNRMLCSLAIFDLIACTGDFILRISIFVGWRWMPQNHCVWPGVGIIFGGMGGSVMLTFVNLDRILMFKFPTKHKKWSSKRYPVYMSLPAVFYGSLLFVAAVVRSNDTLQPVCLLGNALHGDAFKIMIISLPFLMISVISTSLYGAKAAAKPAASAGNNQSEQTKNKIKRFQQSLLIIVGIYLSTYVVSSSSRLLITVFKIKDTFYLHLVLAFGVVVSQSCNAFVLAWRSQDYRNEFKKVIGLFLINGNNQVQPMG